MKISICVVFHNSETQLPRLLDSFQHLPRQIDFEFIFIDNASTDKSANIVAGFPCSRYFFRNLNHLAQARNDAIKLSLSDWIYFIDSDCELTPTTFSELLVSFKPQDVSTAGWGGAQSFPPLNDFLFLLDQFRKTYLGHFGSAQMKLGDRIESVDHLSTSHVLYRKSALLLVQGFDSRLGESAEDLDMSFRLRKVGQELIFVPSSLVNHYVADNFKQWFHKAWRNGQWQTRLSFYNFEIVKTRRFLIPTLLGSGLFFCLVFGMIGVFMGLAGFYCLILILVVRSKNPKLYGLFIMTHGLYFAGGLWGLLKGINDFIFSYHEPKWTSNK